MAEFATARVHLWDRRVGVLAESTAGDCIFEYDPGFRESGLELSPIHLPLRRSGPVTFPELRRTETFQGLPGVFADSLPDSFGNRLIRRYFNDRGRPSAALSPVQRLLYVGTRGMGALTYEPAMAGPSGNAEVLEIRELVDQARKVIEGDTSGAVAEIMRVGATAGGARPKALVLWDRRRNRIRSGHASPRASEEPWMIKFDGVTRDSGGLENHVTADSAPWGRVEYAYSRMARTAGIVMAETHLLRDGHLAHFMTRRFDRGEGHITERLHMHTLGGMLHLDYNQQYQIGYEDWFDTIRTLGMGAPEVEQAFRRMAFAVATVNLDDHLKNFAFLMDGEGRWSLSPAYDVAFAENQGWTRQHQMSVNGRFREIRREDILEVGHAFDLRRGGAELLDEVLDSVSTWNSEATEAGLDSATVAWFQERLEREMAPLRPPPPHGSPG